MKKTTILAAFLVLAIAISAVWFARDTSHSEQNSSPVAAVAEPEPEVVSNVANSSGLEASQSESAQSGPVRFFSPVDVFDDEYRDASQEAGAMLARITDPPVVRRQVLLRDQGLVSEFIRQVTSGGLTQAFDVSPFADDPCTVSSIDYTSPKLTPGENVPNDFLVYLYCDSSNKRSTAQVNMSERSVSFFMTYGVKSYTVSPIGDSKYSIAFESHYEMPGESARRPDSFSIPRNDE